MSLTKHRGIVGIACAYLLLGWYAAPARGQQGDQPYTRGVLTTVIKLQTNMGTLQTEAGEIFEVWRDSLWRQGDTVLCDLHAVAPRSRLERCRFWQRQHVTAPPPQR